MSAKRVYKNWLLDAMKTTIYFNLVAFSALTWYNLDFGGNHVGHDHFCPPIGGHYLS